MGDCTRRKAAELTPPTGEPKALTLSALADYCFHLLARLADIYAQMAKAEIKKVDGRDAARESFVVFCIVRA